MASEHEVSREEFQAEALYYADQDRKYKAGLRYCLALVREVPWSEVRDEDIQSIMRAVENLGVEA